MDLSSAPVTDVRPRLSHERYQLLELLRSLEPDEWDVATAAPGWSVRDVALHLLDDDLGWLSRGRDHERRGLLTVEDHDSFVASLSAKNQRWVDGAHGMSARVVTDLLEWSGLQMDDHYASMDLLADGHVGWASDGPVPLWFDIAQDLTERWVHQMQIRESLGRVEDYATDHLPVVLRTFVWALPHQYRVEAPVGTQVEVDLDVGGRWVLVSDGAGRWSLEEWSGGQPHARADVTGDAAWRWLTGARIPTDGVRLAGPAALCEPLLAVRGILA